jgi:hypothetical protein
MPPVSDSNEAPSTSIGVSLFAVARHRKSDRARAVEAA